MSIRIISRDWLSGVLSDISVLISVRTTAGDRRPDLQHRAYVQQGRRHEAEDDRLPKRLLTEPITNGPSKGMLSQLPLTLPAYYAARGWVNAFPTDETLKKLGLDECMGKLVQ